MAKKIAQQVQAQEVNEEVSPLADIPFENEQMHPDDVLIAELHAAATAYQSAKAAVDSRIAAIRAAIAPAPNPDIVSIIKGQISQWIDRTYAPRIARTIKTEIDLDGWTPAQAESDVLQAASEEMIKMATSGAAPQAAEEDVRQSILHYVLTAGEGTEDGCIWSDSDKAAIKAIFAPRRVTPSKRADAEPNANTTIATHDVFWPETDIKFTASVKHDGSIKVQGRAKSILIERLQAVGIETDNARVDEMAATLVKAL